MWGKNRIGELKRRSLWKGIKPIRHRIKKAYFGTLGTLNSVKKKNRKLIIKFGFWIRRKRRIGRGSSWIMERTDSISDQAKDKGRKERRAQKEKVRYFNPGVHQKGASKVKEGASTDEQRK